MTNQRWKRVKRGKFGRVSILSQHKTEYVISPYKWEVEYFYLDGMRDELAFENLNEAIESQTRFLRGGMP
jgi:hypothetical protein